MRAVRVAMMVAAGAAMAMGARPAEAIVFQTTAAQTAGVGAGQSFLNGEAELIVSYSNGTAAGCSGSLLAGGTYVLTAAHCVTGDSDNLTASSISINFANVGLTVASSSYTVDPVWNGNVNNGGDLAVISLATAITSIMGYQLDTAASAVGDTVTLAGYGMSGTGTTGASSAFGTLYFGTNVYLGNYTSDPTAYGYTFNATGPDASLIAPGDSGGAALYYTNGSYQIVGVHDFNTCVTPGCTPGTTFGNYGGDSSVYADSAFLAPYEVAVPEPGTAPLLAAGLGAAVVAFRRRRG